MPIGNFVNLLPPAFFLAVHLAAFALGAYFVYRAFGAEAGTLGWAFSLFAVAEVTVAPERRPL